VIEWHGWATVRVTPENRDTEDDEEEEVLQEVRRIVAEASGNTNEVLDLRDVNYTRQLWFAGSHNHVATVVPVFEAIAAAAPGSYGLLYIHDDELPAPANNEWQVWVMKRGEVHQVPDPFLSPYRPTVEDSFSQDI